MGHNNAAAATAVVDRHQQQHSQHSQPTNNTEGEVCPEEAEAEAQRLLGYGRGLVARLRKTQAVRARLGELEERLRAELRRARDELVGLMRRHQHQRGQQPQQRGRQPPSPPTSPCKTLPTPTARQQQSPLPPAEEPLAAQPTAPPQQPQQPQQPQARRPPLCIKVEDSSFSAGSSRPPDLERSASTTTTANPAAAATSAAAPAASRLQLPPRRPRSPPVGRFHSGTGSTMSGLRAATAAALWTQLAATEEMEDDDWEIAAPALAPAPAPAFTAGHAVPTPDTDLGCGGGSGGNGGSGGMPPPAKRARSVAAAPTIAAAAAAATATAAATFERRSSGSTFGARPVAVADSDAAGGCAHGGSGRRSGFDVASASTAPPPAATADGFDGPHPGRHSTTGGPTQPASAAPAAGRGSALDAAATAAAAVPTAWPRRESIRSSSGACPTAAAPAGAWSAGLETVPERYHSAGLARASTGSVGSFAPLPHAAACQPPPPPLLHGSQHPQKCHRPAHVAPAGQGHGARQLLAAAGLTQQQSLCGDVLAALRRALQQAAKASACQAGGGKKRQHEDE
ncbi:hypothetical protein HXX76_013076 [Chlamydomonas incerta]|uniref:Uncharacterized protein n=1 Tax=Chlamydomonas incerta TaxID=51695 RepID=A0A835SQD2_CHLIN|nr:hypothetical protein HXX76_013076 [Chlamydomonas incerta]|eukprot:KAG2426319.1 hypothetical protein HXX76_013076 [Chlamydomonas incerta]